jgi:type IV secretion system protein VirB11
MQESGNGMPLPLHHSKRNGKGGDMHIDAGTANLSTRDSVLDLLFEALGPVREILLDRDTTDIYVNDDGMLWVEKLGVGRVPTGMIIPEENAEMVIRIIASKTATTVTAKNPILSAEIPGDGSRFEGLLPPVTTRPVFAIRKRASMVIRLDQYIEQKVMTQAQCSSIKQAVESRKNILVVGGTGSGKTTLVNAILADIGETQDHRILILEDTQELQCPARDKIFLRTADGVSMTRLLRSCMRLRPDRIIVGEVRGAEALDMLKAWNTGHPGGICTIHANSAEQGLSRVMMCAREAGVDVQPSLIAAAIDMIVFITREGTGRVVKEVWEVDGYDEKNGKYALKRIA